MGLTPPLVLMWIKTHRCLFRHQYDKNDKDMHKIFYNIGISVSVYAICFSSWFMFIIRGSDAGNLDCLLMESKHIQAR